MHVQLVWFDGPRSDEAVEASRRAGSERLMPLIESHPDLRTGLLGGVRAVGPDGAECAVVLARDAAALDTLESLVMSSELLPGEDPAMLTGPDRVARYVASDVFGRLADLVTGAER
ncbi:MAG: hypothetical protein L0H79_18155 [Intrasporangium sp.]|uniref:hypothetical protein n=1 Tax=Intrasporangium sp. TaxID=1925024 RepID=UPI0026486881|nr:hypothetical protein [Intrasporangium sp.]MDN5797650.1 hypothetical protein [Intrasporangium sp.]